MDKYSYLTNTPLDKAVAEYMAFLGGLQTGTERISSARSAGRVTAHAVYAALCSPHYCACAMDGIALDARLTFGAGETTPVTLREKDYIRVDTGDPLPPGCDAVVMAEDAVDCEGGVRLYSPAAPWQHIRQIGEDIAQGDMLLPSYTRISPAAAGALLAGGALEVEVIRRPVVGVIPTGDEVEPPSADPSTGAVMDFNSAIFSGLISQWGGEPKVYPIIKDDKGLIRDTLARAANECDAVLLCAGTSAGRDDYTASAISELGSVCCHGIAIRPGKPAVLGKVNAKPVIGVPGYPVSGVLVLELIFRPVMAELTKQPSLAYAEYATATLTRRVVSSLKYREFIRARLTRRGTSLLASPIAGGAGVVTGLVKADCLIDIPQNSEGAMEGDTVNVRLLSSMPDSGKTVCVTGSHDPLIDEIADILRIDGSGISVAASHVGSMGGILAIKRGAADAAGIHLLDARRGGYNISYLREHFPNGGAVLIRGVNRTQGLMVKPGNPKGIAGIADLALPDISYVNRQRGSGTRILLDYLIEKADVSPATIHGYAREELTHTAVAAQVAADADAGLGILSAARIYGLGFIPICPEEYDLLVSEAALDTPAMQAFITVLQSPQLKARLERMGGYETDDRIGELIWRYTWR